MLRKLALFAVPLLLVAQATAARAAAPEEDDEEQQGRAGNDAPPAPGPSPPPAEAEPAPDDAAAPAPARDDSDWSRAGYYPPPIDGPALRLPEQATRIYLDGGYGISNDLTALPYIEGKGRNVRAALGGAIRWGRFAFDGQLPFNLTMIEVPRLLNQDTMPQDVHQTALSIGDLTLGATFSERLSGDSEAIIGGLAVRGRLATHTTRFTFHLLDGTLAMFSIPYYFHVEPTLILGGALGRFTWVINQGAIWMLGPNGYIQDTLVTVPSIYFYDGHYAIAYAPWSFLGASVELTTTIQLNHIAGVDYQKFNGVRAVSVAPALQIYAGDAWRIDLIARLGLTHGEELLGVIEFVGTHSFTLRVTRAF